MSTPAPTTPRSLKTAPSFLSNRELLEQVNQEVSAGKEGASSVQRIRQQEQSIAFLSKFAAIVSIVSMALAFAELELAVSRLPISMATSIVGNCRGATPSFLVRSQNSFSSLQGVFPIAAKALPASPRGFLRPTQSVSTNNGSWAQLIRQNPLPWCLNLPRTNSSSCSYTGDEIAAFVMAVADRISGAAAMTLRPRAWASLLGTNPSCLSGIRSKVATSFGATRLPTSEDVGMARGADGATLEAIRRSDVGVQNWPPSSFEGQELSSVAIPNGHLLALEHLAGLLQASPASNSSLLLWRYALNLTAVPTLTTYGEIIESARSVQRADLVRAAVRNVLHNSTSGGILSLLGLHQLHNAGYNASGWSQLLTPLGLSTTPSACLSRAIGGDIEAACSFQESFVARVRRARSHAVWDPDWWQVNRISGFTSLDRLTDSFPSLANVLSANERLSVQVTTSVPPVHMAGVWGVRTLQSIATAVLLTLTLVVHCKRHTLRRQQRLVGPNTALCAPSAACRDTYFLSRRVVGGATDKCMSRVRACCPCKTQEELMREERLRRQRVRDSIFQKLPTASPFSPKSRFGSANANTLQYRLAMESATAKRLSRASGSQCEWAGFVWLFIELCMVAIHMPLGVAPVQEGRLGPSLFVLLSVWPVVGRMNRLFEALYASSDLSGAAAKLLIALSGQTWSKSFFLKVFFLKSPWSSSVVGAFVVLLAASVVLHATETLVCVASRVPTCVPLPLTEAIYMVAISTTTVGYGARFVPKTIFGSIIVVVSSLGGLWLTAMIVAQVVRWLSLSPGEELVMSLLRKASVRYHRKHVAASAIQTAWHWSREHRQSLLWTQHHVRGLVFRPASARADSSLRATGAVANWASFRSIAGRSLLDADVGPRRRLLAAFSSLHADEALEESEQIKQTIASAVDTVQQDLPIELRLRESQIIDEESLPPSPTLAEVLTSTTDDEFLDDLQVEALVALAFDLSRQANIAAGAILPPRAADVTD
jgi:hypothetical protein